MAEILSEHQVQESPKENITPELQYSEATAKMVNRLLAQAQRATKDMRAEWPVNYRFVCGGEQWSIRRPRWRFSEVVNVVWSDIMTEVGIQTDARPKVDYGATEPSDFQFADTLKAINDANWDKPLITGHGWGQKVETAVFKSKIYHVVHAYVGWDPEMENGLGDIDFKILDPYLCFWDPKAENLHEARWFIYTEIVPTAKLREKYPRHAARIKPDITMFAEGGSDKDVETDIDRYFLASQMMAEKRIRTDRDTDKYGGEEMTLKIRCWIKDETVIDEEQSRPDGTREYVKKLQFPRGRYIEVANNCTLEDRENEFEDGLFPIARLVNYDYGEYAGENEVTQRRGPQTVLNYVWSYILDQMKMGANPQTVVTHAARKIVKKLTNEPGLVIEVPTLGDMRKEPGVGIPPGMFNILQEALALDGRVGGLQDVTRGAPQPGITSGLMLEGFVEAAQTRPRLKNRSLDRFLTEVGYLMASRYLQFYKAPRVFRITNQEGFPEFVEFFIRDTKDGKQAVVRKFDAETHQPFPEAQVTPVKGLPDVKVVSGSNLPFARAQKTATALDLHSRGAITLESLLEAINWPNAEEEVKKVREEQANMPSQGGMNAV